jgi:hypothetical protein
MGAPNLPRLRMSGFIPPPLMPPLRAWVQLYLTLIPILNLKNQLYYPVVCYSSTSNLIRFSINMERVISAY